MLAQLTLLFVLAAAGADWPQWRGSARNGVSSEAGFISGWPEGSELPVAWRASVGKGHSAVSISAGRAYTTGWSGESDTVYCLEASTGRILWKRSYPCRTIKQWPGPRSTPAVAGGMVYTLGQHGQLRAHDAASGDLRWARDLPETYQPDVDYGFTWSPLIAGDLLLLGGGRKGLALDRRDGGIAWGDDGQHGACASPVPYSFQGISGVVVLTTDPGRRTVTIAGVDPRDGKALWRSDPWPERWGAVCADPLVHQGRVFITSAEQHLRCGRFSIRGDRLVEDWSNAALCSYTGAGVLIEDHLYGVNKSGILKCLDWNTGRERWANRGFGSHGALIAAGKTLIVQTSHTGELVVVEAAPASYLELRRMKVFDGEPATFTPPVLANGRLYCRSYEGEVVCLTAPP